MPFVLMLAGAVLIVAAVRNTQQQLFYLLALDFTGQNNFVYWFLSILIIGALGYIPKAKPLSDGFLILVILVLFLRKGTGFFDMFQKQIALTEASTPNVSATGTAGQSFAGGGGGGFGVTLTGGGGGGGTTISGIGIGIGGGPFGTGGFGSGIRNPFECDLVSDPLCIGNIFMAS